MDGVTRHPEYFSIITGTGECFCVGSECPVVCFYWNRFEIGVLTFLDVEFVLLAEMEGALCGDHPCII